MPASTVSGLQHRGTGPTRRLAIACTLLAVLSAGASSSNAKVWTVEKDGSGDFMVIQDAVDASAPGDTILVGPGRFEDFHIFDSVIGPQTVIVAITHDLTILGAGEETTIIGPAAPGYEYEGKPTRAIFGRGTGAAAVVKGLRVENTQDAFYFGKSLSLERVTIFEVKRSTVLMSISEDLQLIDCRLESQVEDPVMGHTQSGLLLDSLIIRNCQFLGPSSGTTFVSMSNVASAWIEDVVFRDGAVVFWLAGHAILRRCRFEGTKSQIFFDNTFQGELYDCQLDPTTLSSNLRVGFDAQVIGQNLRIGGGSPWTVQTSGATSSLILRNSDIYKGEELTVRSLSRGTMDLRYNYWGTTETDSIDAWIEDRNDCEPTCNNDYAIVEYEPFLLQPVPTQQKSIGSLKSLFGDQ